MKSNDVIIAARRTLSLDGEGLDAALSRVSDLFGAEYAASLNKKNTRARADSLTGALLLADALSAYGLIGGRIVRTSADKPFFENGCLNFSISHDGGYAVCAASAVRRVGVDLVRLPHRLDAEGRRRLAARCFTPEEATAVARDGSEELFATLWARREAAGKLEGDGVTPFFSIPIPQKYEFSELYLADGERCGLVSLCLDAPAGGVTLQTHGGVSLDIK